ncbi:MAG: hypothetical protein K2O13_07695, partial [Lachnospiraceae bacterium]|nr:hypothetical protein [Lachnospiraceae bacterium]
MLTGIGYGMILLIVFLLIREKSSLSPVFIIIPVAAALLCGFSMEEIAGFVAQGIESVLNTALLFVFSIVYFSILSEVGIFELMVQRIMKHMSNHIAMLLIITTVIAMGVQMDGSGAMTMLITIPAMLPLFDAMKVRRTVLVFLVSASAGVMNVLPWCSAMLRASASTGLDAVEIWNTMLPLQVIGALVLIVMDLVIAGFERRNHSGMTDEEFLELKEKLKKPVPLKVPRGVLVFDILFTIGLIVLLLMGKVNSTMGFMIGLAVILVVNFPKVKEQEAQIKKHGATAYPLVLVIFSLGVLIGIMKNTGMVDAIAHSLIALIPPDGGRIIPFIYGLVGVPISVVLGSDCCYSILAPIIGTIAAQSGGSMMQAVVAVLLGSSFAANITFIVTAPYPASST